MLNDLCEYMYIEQDECVKFGLVNPVSVRAGRPRAV